MISALHHMRAGVAGVFALLIFKTGWREHFDVSVKGVGLSFSGIVLGLPAFTLLIMSIHFFVADNAVSLDADASVSLFDAVLIWARFWLVFPLISASMVMLLQVKNRYAGWLVVHNWTVFVLIHIQAFLLALYPAGLINSEVLGAAISFYQLARPLVHWRVAHGALGLSPLQSAIAAAIPLIIDLILLELLS